MYWFKPKAILPLALIGVLACALAGCRPDIKETGGELKYFDLKGFFTQDTALLNKITKPILKTVTHNGATESKSLVINNWGKELDLFIGADINRPAWKYSYNITNSDAFTIYKAKTPDLHVREMLIKKAGQKVEWILIYTRTKSFLYQTTEKLTYYPDSLYIIEKDQKVKLMGKNHYKIEGKIRI